MCLVPSHRLASADSSFALDTKIYQQSWKFGLAWSFPLLREAMAGNLRLHYAPDRRIDCPNQCAYLHREYLRWLQGHNHRHQEVHKIFMDLRPDHNAGERGASSAGV